MRFTQPVQLAVDEPQRVRAGTTFLNLEFFTPQDTALDLHVTGYVMSHDMCVCAAAGALFAYTCMRSRRSVLLLCSVCCILDSGDGVMDDYVCLRCIYLLPSQQLQQQNLRVSSSFSLLLCVCGSPACCFVY
jgi:hypothetical protein